MRQYRQTPKGAAYVQEYIKHQKRYKVPADVKRAQRKRYELKNRSKFLARRRVANALGRGELVKPLTCSACSKPSRIHAHHEDYSKPLEVIWLCHGCHMKIHIERGDIGNGPKS